MTSLRIMGAAAALVFLAAGPGGCSVPEEPASESGASAELDAAGADSSADGADVADDETATLASVAEGVASGDGGPSVAWSQGYTSISINNDYSPSPDDSPGYSPPSPGDSNWGDSFVDSSGDSGGTGDSGSSGDSGATGESRDSGESDESIEILPEEPCEDFYPERCYTCHEWGGEYESTIYARETETLQGYGGSSKEMKFCSASMSFDEDGVPEWIPIPIFARGMTRVGVRFVGETKVYSFWVYRMTVTVVSATYTPTSADVVLDIDLGWFGEYASIWAAGRHTMHTDNDGEGVLYSSRTHYDGGFFAAGGDPDHPGQDWQANATQDYDCSATLLRP